MQRLYAVVTQFGPGEWFAFGSVVVALIGACVSVFAIRIEVQDNVDRFIADLTRQARWNGIAATINVVAGALIFISVAITILDEFGGRLLGH